MPTIIDALVVTLGIDAKQYKEGSASARADLKKTSDAATKTAVDMEARGKQAALFFSKLRNEALMFLGVFTAGMGLKNFTVDTIRSAAGLDRMSANLNVSARDLEMWRLANKNAGGSAEGMAAQLQKASDSVASARMGIFDSTMHGSVLWGGIDPGKVTSGTDLLIKQSKAISDMYKRDPNRARFIAQQMGIGDDTFNLMKLGPEGIGKARQAQGALADQMGKTSGQAETLRKRFDTLSNRLTSTGVMVLTQFIPQIDQLITKVGEFSQWVSDHKEDIQRWIQNAIKWFGDLFKKFDEGAKSVGGWKNVLLALAAIKVMAMVSPFNALAAALLSLGGALKLIGSVGPLGVAAIGTAAIAAAAYAVYNPLPESVENDNAVKRLKSVPKGDVMNRAMEVVDKLQKRGMDKEHAQGVVGNLIRESSMNPRATSMLDGKSYVGLAQWGPARQAQFKARYGHDLSQSTVDEQVDFLMWELSHTEKSAGDSLRMSPNNQVAARIFQTEFERSKNAAADLPLSQGYAAAVHNAMLNRPNVANGPVMPLNTVNMVNAAGRVSSVPSSNSSTEVSVGNVTINTQATDAKGVAASLGDYIKTNILAAQANTGMR